MPGQPHVSQDLFSFIIFLTLSSFSVLLMATIEDWALQRLPSNKRTWTRWRRKLENEWKYECLRDTFLFQNEFFLSSSTNKKGKDVLDYERKLIYEKKRKRKRWIPSRALVKRKRRETRARGIHQKFSFRNSTFSVITVGSCFLFL